MVDKNIIGKKRKNFFEQFVNVLLAFKASLLIDTSLNLEYFICFNEEK